MGHALNAWIMLTSESECEKKRLKNVEFVFTLQNLKIQILGHDIKGGAHYILLGWNEHWTFFLP